MMYKSIEKKFNRFYLLSKVTDFSNHSSTYIAWHMIDDRPSWAVFRAPEFRTTEPTAAGANPAWGKYFRGEYEHL